MQAFDLIEEVGCQADVDYVTKLHKFQRVESLTLFFDASFGGDELRLDYIGLRGEVNENMSSCVYVCACVRANILLHVGRMNFVL